MTSDEREIAISHPRQLMELVQMAANAYGAYTKAETKTGKERATDMLYAAGKEANRFLRTNGLL